MRALRGIRVNRDAELVYYPVYLSVVTFSDAKFARKRAFDVG